MRNWKTLLGAALLVTTVAAPAVATPSTHEIEARLVDTHIFGLPADQVQMVPGDDPGTNWLSDGIWHVRGVPVTETMKSLDGSTVVGSLQRAFNFNLNLATGASTAWCSFSMTFTNPDLGTFTGRCGGDLVSGTIVGNGATGHLQGSYVLEAGGVAGVGPYVIDLDVQES